MTVLVFPSSVEGCLPFLQEAKRHGRRVIGASSVEGDPYADRFDVWEQLPYLQDADFPQAFVDLLNRHFVKQLYTSHTPTYHFLTQHSELLPVGVTFVEPSPYDLQSDLVRDAWEGLDDRMARIDTYAGKVGTYTYAFIASLLHASRGMYGECQEEKALALCGALADAPAGDIIEIGTFFGKSAYLLNRLATVRGIGPVLAVDSWDMQTSVQRESPIEIQDLSAVWDWEVVFNGFLLSTAASAVDGHFNYLRKTSAEAWTVYDSGAPILSPEFGETKMIGRIALLHIDGNHDEPAVREDFDLWSSRLADGGWIVFDDYAWSHGSGPRKVADKVVLDYGDRILRHFVSGGALFLKIAIRA